MRNALLILLSVGASLPLQAAPPAGPTPTPPQTSTTTTTPASHSRLGEMMGSLTRALQEASEQRARPGQPNGTSLDDLAAKPSATPSATTLPPDASAQAAVP